MCCLQLSKEGLTLRWEDVSKSLQSSVFLNSEVRVWLRLAPACPRAQPELTAAQIFASYQCPWVRRVTGISFTTLIDVLSVFATMSGAEAYLRYPGPDEEFICECAAAQRLLCNAPGARAAWT